MNKQFDSRQYKSVILGTLLHDVGKFLQKPHGKSAEHSIKGVEFLAEYREKIMNLGFDYDLVHGIISLHHDKNYRQAGDSMAPIIEIIRSADQCAAGERIEEMDETRSQYNPLDTVLSHVYLDTEKIPVTDYPRNDYHYKLGELSYKNIFPEKYKLDVNENAYIKNMETAYADLQSGFYADFKKALNKCKEIPDSSKGMDSFIAAMYSLLYKYTWCVPDDVGRAIRDISLFDHTRIAASVAACAYIYRHFASAGDVSGGYLLIGGDLSGIQSYLYDIATVGVDGVAKRLRARSFFLSILIETITHRILMESVGEGIELPFVCKIISGGGNFIILAPDIQPVRDNLEKIKSDVNMWLLKEFQGELSITIGAVSLKEDDFEIKRERKGHCNLIGEKIALLRGKIEEEKKRKLSMVISGESVWAETNFIWEKKFSFGLCSSCRKNPALAHEKLCERCDNDRQFSEWILKSGFICYTRTAVGGDYVYSLFDGKYRIKIAEDATRIAKESYLVQVIEPDKITFDEPCYFSPLANYVSRFQNKDEMKKGCDCLCPNKCDFYQNVFGAGKSGNEQKFPAVKPFGCLAALSEGEKLLGILRADVDNMGVILSEGLGHCSSLSRIATLSRMLDLFFSGWISDTLKKDFKDVYTVYSGGDDLFLVGPWYKIIELSGHIAENFRKFVSCNPQVTLSAGIAVTKPRFPIARSAELAGEYLDKRAKRDNSKRKNSVHLFGTTAAWFKRSGDEIDFTELMQWESNFSKWLKEENKDEKVTSALLYNLLKYSEMCKEFLDKKQVEKLRYLPLMNYTIGRNTKEKSGVRNKLSELTAYPEYSKNFAKFRMPLTWALLKARRTKQNEQTHTPQD